WPIAKPSPHLHQRVEHVRGAEEVTDGQPFEREPAAELVTPYCDDIQTSARPRVGESVSGSTVDPEHPDSLKGGLALLPDVPPFGKRRTAVSKPRDELMMHRRDAVSPDFPHCLADPRHVGSAARSDDVAECAQLVLDLLGNTALDVHEARG